MLTYWHVKKLDLIYLFPFILLLIFMVKMSNYLLFELLWCSNNADRQHTCSTFVVD